MDERALWDKFCENGNVYDYLEYRNCVNSTGKAALKPCDEDKCTGSGHKGAECR